MLKEGRSLLAVGDMFVLIGNQGWPTSQDFAQHRALLKNE
jgi:hypothetical protein